MEMSFDMKQAFRRNEFFRLVLGYYILLLAFEFHGVEARY